MKRRMTAIIVLLVLLMAFPTLPVSADYSDVIWLPSGMIPDEDRFIFNENGLMMVWDSYYDKVGIIDSMGMVVLPLEYDEIYDFSEGLACVRKNDAYGNSKYGFIDRNGIIVIPVEYDWLDDEFEDGIIRAEKKDSYGNWNYGYINKNGETVIPFEYNDLELFEDGLARVAKKDSYDNWKYGYINKNGETVIPLEYEQIGTFADGLAWAVTLEARADSYVNWNYGYINKNGETVIPFEYDSARNFYEGVAVVGKKDYDENRKYGLVDTRGKVVVPLEYDAVGKFSEGLLNVGKIAANGQSKWGYINTAGKVVIPFGDYYDARPFENGLAMVGRKIGDWKYEYGFIDKTGKLVAPIRYAYIDTEYGFSNSLILVGIEYAEETSMEYVPEERKYKYGILNAKGEEVLPAEYDEIKKLGEGHFFARKWKDDWGKNYDCIYFNEEGAVVTFEDGTYIEEFSDGLAVVYRYDDGEGRYQYGCIDESGQFVIQPTSEIDISDFSEGLFAAYMRAADGKKRYGYVDKSGSTVIKPQFAEAEKFQGGLAVVGLYDDDWNVEYGLIDKNGKKLLKCEYDAIAPVMSGRYWIVRKGLSFGYFKNPLAVDEAQDTNGEGAVKEDNGVFAGGTNNNGGSDFGGNGNDGNGNDGKENSGNGNGGNESGSIGNDGKGNSSNGNDNKGNNNEGSGNHSIMGSQPGKSVDKGMVITLIAAGSAAGLVIFVFAMLVVLKNKKAGKEANTAKEGVSQSTDSNTSDNKDIQSLELLKKYKELLDAGAITEQEYNEKKAQVLKR